MNLKKNTFRLLGRVKIQSWRNQLKKKHMLAPWLQLLTSSNPGYEKTGSSIFRVCRNSSQLKPFLDHLQNNNWKTISTC